MNIKGCVPYYFKKHSSYRQLTEEQQIALAGHAFRWTVTAISMHKPRDESKDIREGGLLHVNLGDYEFYMMSAHMLVLALDHLDECLRLLSSGWPKKFPTKEAQAYQSAWQPNSDLRDALEHEEAYIAGRGRQPRLLGEGQGGWTLIRGIRVPFMESSHRLDCENKIAVITALGKSYEILPAVNAARVLLRPLHNYLYPGFPLLQSKQD